MSDAAPLCVYFDGRWMGEHGIGRFATEVFQRSDGFELRPGRLNPSHPLDVIYTTWRVLVRRRCIWFSPGYNVPIVGLSRYVVTVHDLNHVDVPGSGLAKRLYYSLVLRPACRKAARVLTVSEFSRRRIIEWAGVNAEKVVNVGNGVDRRFNASVTPHMPGFPYLLSVSNRKAHKNENRIVEAFAQAALPVETRLLFTGEKTESLAALVESHSLSERTEFVGAVSDDDLASLYRGATALVFPSLYEGFGLPVLEAMACGTPVLTSTVSALPEVADDSALLVDPCSVADIAAGMEILCGDGALRERLAARGVERASLYQWDHVAAKVAAVLREVKDGHECHSP